MIMRIDELFVIPNEAVYSSTHSGGRTDIDVVIRDGPSCSRAVTWCKAIVYVSQSVLFAYVCQIVVDSSYIVRAKCLL